MKTATPKPKPTLLKATRSPTWATKQYEANPHLVFQKQNMSGEQMLQANRNKRNKNRRLF